MSIKDDVEYKNGYEAEEYQNGYEAARQEDMKLMLSQTKAVAKIQQENAELRHELKILSEENEQLRKALKNKQEEYYD